MKNLNDYIVDQFIRRVLTEEFDVRGDNCLDIGCGIQPYRKYYEKRFSWLVSIDIEKRSPLLSVISDASVLPFRDESFDFVLCSEVIEHLRRPDLSISEIARVLRPNGYAVITWPFNYSLHEIPNDYWRITEFAMQAWLHEHGLNVKLFFRRGGVFAVVHLIIAQYLENAIEALARIRFVGLLLTPIRVLALQLLEALSWLHFRLILSFGQGISRAGCGLSGPIGSLRLWTLGYCLLIQKAK